MLLTITTTHRPASDLSYLLHKHPAKIQQVEISFGKAHIFYPEVSEEKCTLALLLEIDPVGLVRRSSGPSGNDFALEQYVNDRPYVASSFMSAAIAKAFSTAMNGRCKEKPELVSVAFPLEIELAVLPVRGGENILRQLFEPLGYIIDIKRHSIDPVFPEWGESRYYTVRLSHTITIQQALSHLYVLIPVCDNDKHYWVGQHEVEKLLEKGKDWLSIHPARELITFRYLKHQKSLANSALEILLREETTEEGEEEGETSLPVQKTRIHDQRLMAVRDELVASAAKRVVDLGCGEGKLLKLLSPEKQFEYLLGMDVNTHVLEIAKDKLKTDRLSPRQQQRIQLIQGSLTYRDERIEGFDAAALVEVIEHLDPSRLAALEKVLFGHAKPATVVITTPNAEYNKLFPDYEEGLMRHGDHRFEWNRQEFEAWGNRIAGTYHYTPVYKPVGEEDPVAGALSQMAIFTKNTPLTGEELKTDTSIQPSVSHPDDNE